MLKFWMTAACVLLSLCMHAQSTVRGYVKDSQTKEPLGGATLVVAATGRFASTDERGYFQLGPLKAGIYEMEIRFLGFKTSSVTVAVPQQQALEILLEEDVVMTDEVIVSATRAADKSPTTFTTLSKVVLQKQNFGQDLPFVLNWSPSLVTTSDAGAGVGYTGMRIRGSDATRINVTINGIPVNDSESQGVFWVNTPDLASSTQSVQVQRGVGTSTNGAAAFGATVNLQTNVRNDRAYADIINSVGSFNTWRHTVALGSGLINNRFVFDGRLSQINSDGFVDRASSNLKSYYLSGGYYGEKTMVKAIVFGGKEITYQSWYGVPESRLNNDTEAMLETAAAEGWNQQQIDHLLSSNPRTFNLYQYPDQVDNYAQDHYQLHTAHRLSDVLNANVALHYTRGLGFYEEFRYDNDFEDYGLPEVVIGGETISSTDLVRRRWLDNHFYGVTYSLNVEKDKLNSVLGGGWNRYEGDHFGEITWAAVAGNLAKDYRYYFNNGLKTDFNIFWKNNYALSDRLAVFADLQYRTIQYKTSGIDNDQFYFDVGTEFHFFNPKFGVTYEVNAQQQLYASYSVANREPVRSDFVDAPAGVTPRHETLRNVEAGWRMRKSDFTFTANYYLMDYTNQLVLTGALNDVGAPLRTNVDQSYRTGIELESALRMNDRWTWGANLTLSQNKIGNFKEVLYNYGENFDEYIVIENEYRNSNISFSPNAIAGSVFTYQPIKGLEASLLSKYVSKQYLDNTSNEARKLDAYFVNDVRLSYGWQPKGMREISVSLLVNNLLDERYESNGYTWGYFGGATEYRQNYYYPQAGRNYMLMVALRF
ncbi:MAG: TonB-dependent receptor [Bacteroidota bacterium]